MPTSTFRFAGEHGATITAYRWDPATEPQVIVQLTHGMGEHALRYAPFAEELTARGAVVVAQDHRGHGDSMLPGREPGDLGPDGWTALVAEIGALTRQIRDLHPGLPLVLLGHSMGSFAVQQHLLGHSADVDAVVLTGTAALDLLEPALDLDQPISLAAFNAPFAPARTDYDWLSRDEAPVDAYVADPLCGFGLDQAAGKAMFVGARPLADADRVARMRRDLPLLVAVGEADPVNAGMALVGPLVDRYRAALDDVTLVSYPRGPARDLQRDPPGRGERRCRGVAGRADTAASLRRGGGVGSPVAVPRRRPAEPLPRASGDSPERPPARGGDTPGIADLTREVGPTHPILTALPESAPP